MLSLVALDGIIGAPQRREQVRASDRSAKEMSVNAGLDCTRREDRSSSEAPRREHCRGGVLDRRLDCGGAVGTARRIRVFPGGAVVYTHVARRALLDVPDLASLGMRAATEPYALLLAQTARQRFSAHWAVAESGAAGPAGNRYGDPAGHSCIAVAGPTDRAITLENGQR
jgi:nicotinamide mononucleotide (NMN) deamidase PncC